MNTYELQRCIDSSLVDVAKRVEELSGLRVPLDTLEVKVISREEAAHIQRRDRQILLQPYFPTIENLTYSPAHEMTLAAVYSRNTQTAGIVWKNIPSHFTAKEIKLLLGHELTHHAQFSIDQFRTLFNQSTVWHLAQRHPVLKTQLTQSDTAAIRGSLTLLDSMMRLIEGDAQYIETELEKFYPPTLRSKFSFKPKLKIAGLVFDLTGYDEEKIFDYVIGSRIIQGIVKEKGRGEVNKLYKTANAQEIERAVGMYASANVRSDQLPHIEGTITRVMNSIFDLQEEVERRKKALTTHAREIASQFFKQKRS